MATAAGTHLAEATPADAKLKAAMPEGVKRKPSGVAPTDMKLMVETPPMAQPTDALVPLDPTSSAAAHERTPTHHEQPDNSTGWMAGALIGGTVVVAVLAVAVLTRRRSP